MRRMIVVAALLMTLIGVLIGGIVQVSTAEKRDFIQLLASLPKDGEFFTKAAIDKTVPQIHILFSLTEKDLEGHDFYPVLALSRGLCDRSVCQQYALDHFAEIEHPLIRLSWAAMLFNTKTMSPAVTSYLRESLNSPKQTNFLSELLGPDFAMFKNQVLNSPQ